MPLRRYIFNTLTVVSLLLLLATVGLWVDSYWREYVNVWHDRFDAMSLGDYEIMSRDGFLIIEYWPIPRFYSKGPHDHYWNLFIMQFARVHYGSSHRNVIGIRHWFLAIVFGVLPGVWFIKWRKRRRLAKVGKCPACGYDLTGNESGVCPECGVGTATESLIWQRHLSQSFLVLVVFQPRLNKRSHSRTGAPNICCHANGFIRDRRAMIVCGGLQRASQR